MTDETKGDGMTLAAECHELLRIAMENHANNSDTCHVSQLLLLDVDVKISDIERYLTAQSAMRVDESMVDRAYNACDACFDDEGRLLNVVTRREMLLAALQAAISGKE